MQRTSDLMRRAATAFLAALRPEQRAEAAFPFESDERFRWHFTPIARQGIQFKRLDPYQQRLAHALISTGYSPMGALKAAQIMSLEQVLHEYEELRRFERDPDLYFLTIFGEPSPDTTWGWRLEGHHISLNVTLVDGRRLATTPSFFGANPAEVRQGPRAGLRVLASEEDLARQFLDSLEVSQRNRAIISDDAPDEIISYNQVRASHLGEEGLAADTLTAGQRELLMCLLEEYANAMPAEIASARMVDVAVTPRDALRFAWAGSIVPGHPHYYRIQSPTFLVEYDNTQDGGNHIHCVWRCFQGDWGLDLLGRHLREVHAV